MRMRIIIASAFCFSRETPCFAQSAKGRPTAQDFGMAIQPISSR
jgi:hypothetical protein